MQSADVPRSITDDRAIEPFTTVRPVTLDEATKLLSSAPCKQCSLDPAPSWLVKQVGDVTAPVIDVLCNASFNQAHLPARQKSAIVHPLVKKPSLKLQLSPSTDSIPTR